MKSTRGGARVGAGAKLSRDEKKRPLTINITPTLRAYLNARSIAAGRSLADWIEGEFRRTAAFKRLVPTGTTQQGES